MIVLRHEFWRFGSNFSMLRKNIILFKPIVLRKNYHSRSLCSIIVNFHPFKCLFCLKKVHIFLLNFVTPAQQAWNLKAFNIIMKMKSLYENLVFFSLMMFFFLLFCLKEMLISNNKTRNCKCMKWKRSSSWQAIWKH